MYRAKKVQSDLHPNTLTLEYKKSTEQGHQCVNVSFQWSCTWHIKHNRYS